MKKKLTIVALSIISGFSFVVFTTSTMAWFAAGTHIGFGDDPGNVDISGGSNASYYESGSGASNDPYIISDSIHLYNLAWLQYIGYYNSYKTTFHDDAPNDIVQNYFKLKNNIDMGGLTLPPIGTEKYPFLGNFDGNGCTISNFIISNDNPALSSSDFGVAKPQNFYGGTQPDVVGFFGVVGKLPAQTITYDSSIVSFYNFTLSNFTVRAKTGQVLIGLAAGYVNGGVNNVKISGNATLDVNGQVSTAKVAITDKLSNYGLVGYSTQVSSSGDYAQKLSEFYSNYDTSAGSGHGSDWGGSISTKDYMEWIYRTFTSPAVNNTMEESNINHPLNQRNTLTVSNEYNLEFSVRNANDVNGETSYTKLITKNNNTYYDAFANPTRFNDPDTSRTALYNANSKIKSVVYHFKDGAYLPLNFTDNHAGTNINNTGYIVGDGTVGSSVEGNPQLTARYYTALGNTMDNSRNWTTGNSWNQTSIDSFTNYQNKVEVMTYAFKNENNTTYTGWKRISDEYNANNSSISSALNSYGKVNYGDLGLTKYQNSRSQLQDVFLSNKRIQGILFKNNTVSAGRTITVNAKILGEEKQNYELPKGSVVCNLKKEGFINFFAGSFYGGSSNITNFRCFSLYKIDRKNDNSINALHRITKVYKNSAFNTDHSKPRYFYQYDDNTYSIKEGNTHFSLADRDTSVGNDGLIFDAANSLDLQAPAVSTLYYYEVPVIEGEYCLGLSTQSCQSGMALIYLDIGASGLKDDQIDAHYIIHKRTANEYPLGVDFIPISVSGNGGDTIAISISSSQQGIVTFTISSNSISVSDSSSICEYAYRSTNYVSSGPSANQFTVTGLSGAPPSVSMWGTRILDIGYKSATTDLTYHIQITDFLANEAGTFNESSSTYSIEIIVDGQGQGATSTSLSAINTMIAGTGKNVNTSTSDANSLRNMASVITLQRRAGSNSEFVTTYDYETCSYENKIVSVNMVTNGASMNVTVAAGYTFKIGGTTIANGSVYPS